ncbi:hypothetical protein, partial [Sinorhizobium meliloti]
MILHKSVNAKDFSAAKGCPLCKGKAAGSGRFVQNPSGGPYCGALSRKIRLAGGRPAAPDFPRKSLAIWAVK